MKKGLQILLGLTLLAAVAEGLILVRIRIDPWQLAALMESVALLWALCWPHAAGFHQATSALGDGFAGPGRGAAVPAARPVPDLGAGNRDVFAGGAGEADSLHFGADGFAAAGPPATTAKP